MLTNTQKAELSARLMAARDFKFGRGCIPTEYCLSSSIFAKWYKYEYARLESSLGKHFSIDEINDVIDEIIKEKGSE